MKKPYILGVDPGLSGALAVLDVKRRDLVSVFDIPTIKEGKKNLINCNALGLKLSAYIDDLELAVVEDVHSMPGQGVVSTFSFGVSKGIIIGMLGLGLVPVFLTPPGVWKNCFGLSKDKNKSRELAMDKYPTHKNLFERKKDDGRSEAVLLAEFGRRFW